MAGSYHWFCKQYLNLFLNISKLVFKILYQMEKYSLHCIHIVMLILAEKILRVDWRKTNKKVIWGSSSGMILPINKIEQLVSSMILKQIKIYLSHKNKLCTILTCIRATQINSKVARTSLRLLNFPLKNLKSFEKLQFYL